jgi:hypothetical protein
VTQLVLPLHEATVGPLHAATDPIAAESAVVPLHAAIDPATAVATGPTETSYLCVRF